VMRMQPQPALHLSLRYTNRMRHVTVRAQHTRVASRRFPLALRAQRFELGGASAGRALAATTMRRTPHMPRHHPVLCILDVGDCALWLARRGRYTETQPRAQCACGQERRPCRTHGTHPPPPLNFQHLAPRHQPERLPPVQYRSSGRACSTRGARQRPDQQRPLHISYCEEAATAALRAARRLMCSRAGATFVAAPSPTRPATLHTTTTRTLDAIQRSALSWVLIRSWCKRLNLRHTSVYEVLPAHRSAAADTTTSTTLEGRRSPPYARQCGVSGAEAPRRRRERAHELRGAGAAAADGGAVPDSRGVAMCALEPHPSLSPHCLAPYSHGPSAASPSAATCH
jgi:hypothetical protein